MPNRKRENTLKHPLSRQYNQFLYKCVFDVSESGFTMTVPLLPSTVTFCPSRKILVASCTAMTAGMPYSRATIAPCERMPPTCVMMPPAMAKRGVHTGLVSGATRISPRCNFSNSCGPRTTRTMPLRNARTARNPAQVPFAVNRDGANGLPRQSPSRRMGGGGCCALSFKFGAAFADDGLHRTRRIGAIRRCLHFVQRQKKNIVLRVQQLSRACQRAPSSIRARRNGGKSRVSSKCMVSRSRVCDLRVFQDPMEQRRNGDAPRQIALAPAHPPLAPIVRARRRAALVGQTGLLCRRRRNSRG